LIRADRDLPRGGRPIEESTGIERRRAAAARPPGGAREAWAARGVRAVLAAGACAWLGGCPAPQRPAPPPPPGIAAVTIEIGRAGGSLRGVAGDEAATYAAITSPVAASAESATSGDAAAPPAGAANAGGPEAARAPTSPSPAKPAERTVAERTVIEARHGGASAPAWHAELDGGGGPLARTGTLVVATLSGTGAAAGLPLRGSPGAVAVGLDAATGAVRWRLALDSSEWAIISAASPAPGGGVVLGGSFGGTLRAGAKIVSSGGKADGFVARVSAAGQIELLVRMGGPGTDEVRGIAAAGDRIAIAGTFSAGADLLGTALDPFDARSPAADGFVAVLDAATGRPRWAATFGGKLDDAVAGVAIDGRGRVAVAGTARDVVHVDGRDLRAQGAADALVAWWGADGAPGPALLLGGWGFDGAAAITAAGDRVVVGVFFAGALRAGDREIAAAGGDDALLVALDGGTVIAAWPAGGPGREEIAGLAAVPGGFVAGVAHTAGVRVDGAALPAPADPLAGAALVVRAVR
jgi:hypothetical protein